MLRVITWLPVGGIERRLAAILPRLDQNRFDVSVVCLRERGPIADKLEQSGIPVHCIPFRSRWDPRALCRLTELMKSQRVDIVHSHMYRSNVPATVAAKMAGIRHIWCQVHNVDTWETRRQAWMDRFLSRWREGMIAVSERVKSDIREKLGLPDGRIRVIYNGIDHERFGSAQEARAGLRHEKNLAERDIVFLFAARLVEQKRCADFLEAFGKLHVETPKSQDDPDEFRKPPRAWAWILGDGPLMSALQSQASQLPDPTMVKFWGKKDDVERYMAAADVLVLPSTREGFSNAVIEAMAAGLPIIASDVGGNAEAVEDGKEGIIIPPLQVQGLTYAMRRMLMDHQTRSSMSTAARVKAQRFSLDTMLHETEQLYIDCINRHVDSTS